MSNTITNAARKFQLKRTDIVPDMRVYAELPYGVMGGTVIGIRTGNTWEVTVSFGGSGMKFIEVPCDMYAPDGSFDLFESPDKWLECEIAVAKEKRRLFDFLGRDER